MLSIKSVTTTPDDGESWPSQRAVGSHLVGLPAGIRLSIAVPEPAGKPCPHPSPPVDPVSSTSAQRRGGLTNLEQMVVTLSLRDSLRSTAKPSRKSRILDVIFGRENANRMADPRLEAARVYAVRLRFGDVNALNEARENILRLGFTEDQILAIRLLVTARARKADVA